MSISAIKNLVPIPVQSFLLLISRTYKYLFVLCVGLLIAGWVMDGRMPTPDAMLPELGHEPLQQSAQVAEFTQTEHGTTYYVKPLYTYELYGLVVSKHEANSSFLSNSHARWGDYLNTTDLCVVWGNNAFSGIYQQIKFRSGEWTCFFESKGGYEVYRAFDINRVSNNHMLIGNQEVAKILRDVRIGDQIYFKGYLAEYGTASHRIRGTSTTRTDTGQGACETVYATHVQIIQEIPRIWRLLMWAGVWGIVALYILWFFTPASSPTRQEEADADENDDEDLDWRERYRAQRPHERH